MRALLSDSIHDIEDRIPEPRCRLTVRLTFLLVHKSRHEIFFRRVSIRQELFIARNQLSEGWMGVSEFWLCK